MAINYTYDPVINGVTDADEGYMNHMQEGIQAACDGVDTLNNLKRGDQDITWINGQNAGNTTLYKIGNMVTLNLDAKRTGGFDDSCGVICVLPDGYRPLQGYNTGAFFGGGQWGVTKAGYMYVNWDGSILLNSNGDTSLEFAHCVITYVCAG